MARMKNRYAVYIMRKGQKVILARYNAEGAMAARERATEFAPSSGANVVDVQKGIYLGIVFKKTLQTNPKVTAWVYRTASGKSDKRLFESVNNQWPNRLK